MTLERLLSFQKEELPGKAEELTAEDIGIAGRTGSGKRTMRSATRPSCCSMNRSDHHPDVYPLLGRVRGETGESPTPTSAASDSS